MDKFKQTKLSKELEEIRTVLFGYEIIILINS